MKKFSDLTDGKCWPLPLPPKKKDGRIYMSSAENLGERCPEPARIFEQIGASYLQEIGTCLCHCDHDFYADRCKSAVLALTASSALPPYQVKVRSEAELTAK